MLSSDGIQQIKSDYSTPLKSDCGITVLKYFVELYDSMIPNIRVYKYPTSRSQLHKTSYDMKMNIELLCIRSRVLCI